MSLQRKGPGDVARRLAERRTAASGRPAPTQPGTWRRETYTLPRLEAREKAREWFSQFPKAAYMTEIEFWRDLGDGQIEFTIRRLPSAD